MGQVCEESFLPVHMPLFIKLYYLFLVYTLYRHDLIGLFVSAKEHLPVSALTEVAQYLKLIE
jgi:hypothetical protein